MPSASALFAAPLPVSTGTPEAASGVLVNGQASETAGLFSSKLGDVLQAVGKAEATAVEPAHRAAALLSLVAVMPEEQDAAQTAEPAAEAASVEGGLASADVEGETAAPVSPEVSLEPAPEVETALGAPPPMPMPTPVVPQPVALQPGAQAETTLAQTTVSVDATAAVTAFPPVSNVEKTASAGEAPQQTASTIVQPEKAPASTSKAAAPQPEAKTAPAASVQSADAQVVLKVELEATPSAPIQAASATKTPSADKIETSPDAVPAAKSAAPSVEQGASMKPTQDAPQPLDAKIAEQPLVQAPKIPLETKAQTPTDPAVQNLVQHASAQTGPNAARLDVKVTIQPAMAPAPVAAAPAAPTVAALLTATEALEAVAAETAAARPEDQATQTSVKPATPAVVQPASPDTFAKAEPAPPASTPQHRPTVEASPKTATTEAPASSASSTPDATAASVSTPSMTPSPSAQAAPPAKAPAEAAAPPAPPAPSDAAMPVEGHKAAHAAEPFSGSGPAPSPSALSHATIETTAHLAAQIARKLEGRSTRFDMVLTPEDLGRVDVSLEIGSDGQLAARLAFDNPAAAAELRGRADELRRQLQDAGFQVSNDSLDFTQRDSSSGGGFERQHQQRQALFAGAARVTAEADLPVSPPPGAWTNHSQTRDRVDVRV